MHRKDKGINIKTTAALVIIVMIFGIGGTTWYYALYKITFIQSFDIEVKTAEGKRAGFNADPTLHFGKLPVNGGTAMKEMILTNDRDMPLFVKIKISGDAAQFVTVEDNGFMLQPGEKRKLNVYATIPEGFGEVGIYTGEARIFYMRP